MRRGGATKCGARAWSGSSADHAGGVARVFELLPAPDNVGNDGGAVPHAPRRRNALRRQGGSVLPRGAPRRAVSRLHAVDAPAPFAGRHLHHARAARITPPGGGWRPRPGRLQRPWVSLALVVAVVVDLFTLAPGHEYRQSGSRVANAIGSLRPPELRCAESPGRPPRASFIWRADTNDVVQVDRDAARDRAPGGSRFFDVYSSFAAEYSGWWGLTHEHRTFSWTYETVLTRPPRHRVQGRCGRPGQPGICRVHPIHRRPLLDPGGGACDTYARDVQLHAGPGPLAGVGAQRGERGAVALAAGVPLVGQAQPEGAPPVSSPGAPGLPGLRV